MKRKKIGNLERATMELLSFGGLWNVKFVGLKFGEEDGLYRDGKIFRNHN